MKIIKMFALVLLVSTCIGCSSVLKQKSMGMNEPLKILKETRKTHVILDGSDLKNGEDVKDKLVLQAQKKAILDIAKKWIDESLLFQVCNKRLLSHGEIELNIKNRDFDVNFDKETNIYEADFQFELEMVPSLDYLGEVSGIEGGYSLATSNITIELKGVKPKGDTYVVFAKNNDFEIEDYYQITGFGKIYNVIDKIAQCKIITSSREIRKGDIVFLLRTKTIGTKRIESKEGQIPTVLVRPIVEKRGQGPKEMK